jgi:hypothetical protein
MTDSNGRRSDSRKKGFKHIVVTRFKIIAALFLYIVVVISIGTYTFLGLIIEFLKNTRTVI